MKRFVLSWMIALAPLVMMGQVGDWSGKLDVMGTAITLVFHVGDEKSSLDVPEQGAKDIPVQATMTPPIGVKLSVPMINATYEGVFMGRQIRGTFTQHGQSFPLTLTAGVPMLRRPQTPQPPFPYATEEVTFTNGDATLRGTLVLPQDYTKSTPVVVFVTGSGPQNRDEEIHEHKPFAVIADALARAGIASLRYDDRGFGESTGDVAGMTTEDLKNDALAGVKLMRQRFHKVGVIGHSEGGTIALMLAAEKKADFIISLAGAVISSRETLLWQNRNFLAAAKYPDAVIDEYCKALSDVFNAVVDGTTQPVFDGYDLPAELKANLKGVVAQSGTPYMRYFLTLDMTDALGKITCPVLALNGTKDTQVWGERNLSALQKGLPATRGNSIRAIEGVNHLFQHCQTGQPSEYRSIEETFSPEVLKDMVVWIKAL